MKPKSPTQVTSLQDLADLAGVSRATVSRALSDSPLVNERTRERLQTLARKHRYRVNTKARDLRLQKTRVISVVFMLDKRSQQHMSDPFFLEMLGGIADRVAANDYDLLLAHAPITSVRDLADSRVVRQADGVIFIGQGEEHAALNTLAAEGHNIVVWGAPLADKRYPVIGSDNRGGCEAATEHLLRLGRRHIAFFGNTRTPENVARFEGYTHAHERAGLTVASDLVIDLPSDMPQAEAVVARLVGAGLRVDSVVCTSDVMAIATISAFTRLGLSVPDDVAVVGYDDIFLARYVAPPLTTVRQNIGLAGERLVDAALALIEGKPVEDALMPRELVVRSSCGAAL